MTLNKLTPALDELQQSEDSVQWNTIIEKAKEVREIYLQLIRESDNLSHLMNSMKETESFKAEQLKREELIKRLKLTQPEMSLLGIKARCDGK